MRDGRVGEISLSVQSLSRKDFTRHRQQSLKYDIMFGICYFVRKQLESAKMRVCYDLTTTWTHPFRRLPVNLNLLLTQQRTYKLFN